MAYLKAPGIMRLVGEQKHENARGWWKNDVFWLRSTLDRDELVKFFSEEYTPTPIVAPWAGGSGFFKKDKKDAVKALSESNSIRVHPYAGVIENVCAIIKDESIGDKPRDQDKVVAREIKAYFNLDLALLRGHGLGDKATRLLIALSLFKVCRFLSTGLRLRTACDLEIDGGLTVTRPGGFTIPAEHALLEECTALISACGSLFADPPVTEVEWKPGEKRGKSKKGVDKEETVDASTAD